MRRDDAARPRILIVEDEAIIAMLLEDIIGDLGCDVVGPVARVDQAMEKLGSEKVDGAVLDVNLNGQVSYPIADALAARALPFLFITGYGKAGLDAGYRERPVVDKPINPSVLGRELGALIGR